MDPIPPQVPQTQTAAGLVAKPAPVAAPSAIGDIDKLLEELRKCVEIGDNCEPILSELRSSLPGFDKAKLEKLIEILGSFIFNIPDLDWYFVDDPKNIAQLIKDLVVCNPGMVEENVLFSFLNRFLNLFGSDRYGKKELSCVSEALSSGVTWDETRIKELINLLKGYAYARNQNSAWLEKVNVALKDMWNHTFKDHGWTEEVAQRIAKKDRSSGQWIAEPGWEDVVELLNKTNNGSPLLTTQGTIENYLKNHRITRFVYDHINKSLAIAWISVSPRVLGAPKAELEAISSAIALKVKGNEEEYNNFINAHKPKGMSDEEWLASKAREMLAGGLGNIETLVINLMSKGANEKTVSKAIVKAHSKYNLGRIIKTTFTNIGRFMIGRQPIPFALMTTRDTYKKAKAMMEEAADRNTVYQWDKHASEILLGEDGITKIKKLNEALYIKIIMLFSRGFFSGETTAVGRRTNYLDKIDELGISSDDEEAFRNTLMADESLDSKMVFSRIRKSLLELIDNPEEGVLESGARFYGGIDHYINFEVAKRVLIALLWKAYPEIAKEVLPPTPTVSQKIDDVRDVSIRYNQTGSFKITMQGKSYWVYSAEDFINSPLDVENFSTEALENAEYFIIDVDNFDKNGGYIALRDGEQIKIRNGRIVSSMEDADIRINPLDKSVFVVIKREGDKFVLHNRSSAGTFSYTVWKPSGEDTSSEEAGIAVSGSNAQASSSAKQIKAHIEDLIEIWKEFHQFYKDHDRLEFMRKIKELAKMSFKPAAYNEENFKKLLELFTFLSNQLHDVVRNDRNKSLNEAPKILAFIIKDVLKKFPINDDDFFNFINDAAEITAGSPQSVIASEFKKVVSLLGKKIIWDTSKIEKLINFVNQNLHSGHNFEKDYNWYLEQVWESTIKDNGWTQALVSKFASKQKNGKWVAHNGWDSVLDLLGTAYFGRSMTTAGTIQDYLKNHRITKFVYDHISKSLAIAWISISPRALGAPKAELEAISSAIALKVIGIEWAYNNFINAHKPILMSDEEWLVSNARATLVGGMGYIERKVYKALTKFSQRTTFSLISVIPVNTGIQTYSQQEIFINRAVAKTMVKAHLRYNLGRIIKTTFVNIWRILSGRTTMPYAFMSIDKVKDEEITGFVKYSEAIISYYAARKELLEAVAKGDISAYKEARGKLISSAKKVKKAADAEEVDLESIIEALTKSGKLAQLHLINEKDEPVLGKWDEILHAAGETFSDEQKQWIEEAVDNLIKAFPADQRESIRKIKNKLINNTVPYSAELFIPEPKEIQQRMKNETLEKLLQELNDYLIMTSNFEESYNYGFTSPDLAEPLITMHAVDSKAIFLSAYLHEIVHYLAIKEIIDMPAQLEIVTHAMTAIELACGFGEEEGSWKKILDSLDTWQTLFLAGIRWNSENPDAPINLMDLQMLTHNCIVSNWEKFGFSSLDDALLYSGLILAGSPDTEGFYRNLGNVLGGIIWGRSGSREIESLSTALVWSDTVLAADTEHIAHFTPDPERRARIIAKIQSFLQIITGNRTLKLAENNNPEAKSAFNISNDKNTIEYKPEYLDYPDEDVAEALFLEQIFPLLYSNPGWVEPDYDNSLFLSLFSTMELIRTRHVYADKAEGFLEKFDKLNDALYPNPKSESAKRRMEKLPLFGQFLEGVLFQGRAGKVDPRIKNKLVKKALRGTSKARADVIKMEDTKDAYIVMRDKIWPKLKELVDAAKEQMKEDEIKKRVAEEKGDISGISPEEMQQLLQQIWDNMDPEEKHRIEDEIKKQARKQIEDYIKRRQATPNDARAKQASDMEKNTEINESTKQLAESIKDRLKNLRSSVAEIQGLINEAKGESENLEQKAGKVREKTGVSDITEQDIGNLKDLAETIKSKAEQLKTEGNNVKKDTSKLHNHSQEMRQSSMESARDLKNSAKNLDDKAGNLKKNVDSFDEKSDQLQKEINNLERSAKEKNNASDQRTSAAAVQKSSKDLSDNLEQMKELVSNLENMLGDVNENLDAVEAELSKMEEEARENKEQQRASAMGQSQNQPLPGQKGKKQGDKKSKGSGTEQPVTKGKGQEPGAEGQGQQPGAEGQGQEPGAKGEGQQPGAKGQGQQPGSAGQGQQPGAKGQGQQPGSAGQGKQPGAKGQGQQPGAGGQGQQSGAKGQGQQSGAEGQGQQPGAEGQGQQPGAEGQGQQSGAEGQGQQPGAKGQGQQSGAEGQGQQPGAQGQAGQQAATQGQPGEQPGNEGQTSESSGVTSDLTPPGSAGSSREIKDKAENRKSNFDSRAEQFFSQEPKPEETDLSEDSEAKKILDSLLQEAENDEDNFDKKSIKITDLTENIRDKALTDPEREQMEQLLGPLRNGASSLNEKIRENLQETGDNGIVQNLREGDLDEDNLPAYKTTLTPFKKENGTGGVCHRLIVVIDNSGSMSESLGDGHSTMFHVLRAVCTVLLALKDIPGVEIGVMKYGDVPSQMLLPLTKSEELRDENIFRMYQNMAIPGGSTPDTETLWGAVEVINAGADNNILKTILHLTDGNPGDTDLVNRVQTLYFQNKNEHIKFVNYGMGNHKTQMLAEYDQGNIKFPQGLEPKTQHFNNSNQFYGAINSLVENMFEETRETSAFGENINEVIKAVLSWAKLSTLDIYPEVLRLLGIVSGSKEEAKIRNEKSKEGEELIDKLLRGSVGLAQKLLLLFFKGSADSYLMTDQEAKDKYKELRLDELEQAFGVKIKVSKAPLELLAPQNGAFAFASQEIDSSTGEKVIIVHQSEMGELMNNGPPLSFKPENMQDKTKGELAAEFLKEQLVRHEVEEDRFIEMVKNALQSGDFKKLKKAYHDIDEDDINFLKENPQESYQLFHRITKDKYRPLFESANNILSRREGQVYLGYIQKVDEEGNIKPYLRIRLPEDIEPLDVEVDTKNINNDRVIKIYVQIAGKSVRIVPGQDFVQIPHKIIYTITANKQEIPTPFSFNEDNFLSLSQMLGIFSDPSAANSNIYLEGPRGAGKNTKSYVMAALLGVPVRTMSLFSNINQHDLLERLIITCKPEEVKVKRINKDGKEEEIGFTNIPETFTEAWNSELKEAAIAGELCILDELDKPTFDGILQAINGILDRTEEGINPKFRVICLGNDNEGRDVKHGQNLYTREQALLSRLNIIECDYMSPECTLDSVMSKIFDDSSEKVKKSAYQFMKKVVEVQRQINEAVKQGKLTRYLSVRGVERIAKHYKFFPADIRYFRSIFETAYCTDTLDGGKTARDIIDKIIEGQFKNMITFWQWMKEIRMGNGIMQLGLPSAGKTVLMNYFLKSVLGFKPKNMAVNPKTLGSELLGQWRIKGNETWFERSPLIKAMEEGVPVIIEECDKAKDKTALAAINNIAQFGFVTLPDGNVVIAKPGFGLFMDGNLPNLDGQSSGTASEPISGEVQDRFSMFIQRRLPVDQSIDMLKRYCEKWHYKIEDAFIEALVKFHFSLCYCAENGRHQLPRSPYWRGLQKVCDQVEKSSRNYLDIADLYLRGYPLQEKIDKDTVRKYACQSPIGADGLSLNEPSLDEISKAIWIKKVSEHVTGGAAIADEMCKKLVQLKDELDKCALPEAGQSVTAGTTFVVSGSATRGSATRSRTSRSQARQSAQGILPATLSEIGFKNVIEKIAKNKGKVYWVEEKDGYPVPVTIIDEIMEQLGLQPGHRGIIQEIVKRIFPELEFAAQAAIILPMAEQVAAQKKAEINNLAFKDTLTDEQKAEIMGAIKATIEKLANEINRLAKNPAITEADLEKIKSLYDELKNLDISEAQQKFEGNLERKEKILKKFGDVIAQLNSPAWDNLPKDTQKKLEKRKQTLIANSKASSKSLQDTKLENISVEQTNTLEGMVDAMLIAVDQLLNDPDSVVDIPEASEYNTAGSGSAAPAPARTTKATREEIVLAQRTLSQLNKIKTQMETGSGSLDNLDNILQQWQAMGDSLRKTATATNWQSFTFNKEILKILMTIYGASMKFYGIPPTSDMTEKIGKFLTDLINNRPDLVDENDFFDFLVKFKAGTGLLMNDSRGFMVIEEFFNNSQYKQSFQGIAEALNEKAQVQWDEQNVRKLVDFSETYALEYKGNRMPCIDRINDWLETIWEKTTHSDGWTPANLSAIANNMGTLLGWENVSIILKGNGLLTTAGTIQNYLKKHAVMRFVYNHISKSLAIAWISISPRALGAPKAELEAMSSAIALKMQGNQEEYNNFINAHKPKGISEREWLASLARKTLAGGLEQIETIVRKLLSKGTNEKRVSKAIVKAHLRYNLGRIIKTTFTNIGRFLVGKKPIPFALMTIPSLEEQREKLDSALKEKKTAAELDKINEKAAEKLKKQFNTLKTINKELYDCVLKLFATLCGLGIDGSRMPRENWVHYWSNVYLGKVEKLDEADETRILNLLDPQKMSLFKESCSVIQDLLWDKFYGTEVKEWEERLEHSGVGDLINYRIAGKLLEAMVWKAYPEFAEKVLPEENMEQFKANTACINYSETGPFEFTVEGKSYWVYSAEDFISSGPDIQNFNTNLLSECEYFIIDPSFDKEEGYIALRENERINISQGLVRSNKENPVMRIDFDKSLMLDIWRTGNEVWFEGITQRAVYEGVSEPVFVCRLWHPTTSNQDLDKRIDPYASLNLTFFADKYFEDMQGNNANPSPQAVNNAPAGAGSSTASRPGKTNQVNQGQKDIYIILCGIEKRMNEWCSADEGDCDYIDCEELTEKWEKISAAAEKKKFFGFNEESLDKLIDIFTDWVKYISSLNEEHGSEYFESGPKVAALIADTIVQLSQDNKDIPQPSDLTNLIEKFAMAFPKQNQRDEEFENSVWEEFDKIVEKLSSNVTWNENAIEELIKTVRTAFKRGAQPSLNDPDGAEAWAAVWRNTFKDKGWTVKLAEKIAKKRFNKWEANAGWGFLEDLLNSADNGGPLTTESTIENYLKNHRITRFVYNHISKSLAIAWIAVSPRTLGATRAEAAELIALAEEALKNSLTGEISLAEAVAKVSERFVVEGHQTAEEPGWDKRFSGTVNIISGIVSALQKGSIRLAKITAVWLHWKYNIRHPIKSLTKVKPAVTGDDLEKNIDGYIDGLENYFRYDRIAKDLEYSGEGLGDLGSMYAYQRQAVEALSKAKELIKTIVSEYGTAQGKVLSDEEVNDVIKMLGLDLDIIKQETDRKKYVWSKLDLLKNPLTLKDYGSSIPKAVPTLEEQKAKLDSVLQALDEFAIIKRMQSGKEDKAKLKEELANISRINEEAAEKAAAKLKEELADLKKINEELYKCVLKLLASCCYFHTDGSSGAPIMGRENKKDNYLAQKAKSWNEKDETAIVNLLDPQKNESFRFTLSCFEELLRDKFLSPEENISKKRLRKFRLEDRVKYRIAGKLLDALAWKAYPEIAKQVLPEENEERFEAQQACIDYSETGPFEFTVGGKNYWVYSAEDFITSGLLDLGKFDGELLGNCEYFIVDIGFTKDEGYIALRDNERIETSPSFTGSNLMNPVIRIDFGGSVTLTIFRKGDKILFCGGSAKSEKDILGIKGSVFRTWHPTTSNHDVDIEKSIGSDEMRKGTPYIDDYLNLPIVHAIPSSQSVNNVPVVVRPVKTPPSGNASQVTQFPRDIKSQLTDINEHIKLDNWNSSTINVQSLIQEWRAYEKSFRQTANLNNWQDYDKEILQELMVIYSDSLRFFEHPSRIILTESIGGFLTDLINNRPDLIEENDIFNFGFILYNWTIFASGLGWSGLGPIIDQFFSSPRYKQSFQKIVEALNEKGKIKWDNSNIEKLIGLSNLFEVKTRDGSVLCTDHINDWLAPLWEKTMQDNGWTSQLAEKVMEKKNGRMVPMFGWKDVVSMLKQKGIISAIMLANLPKVNRWANEGKSSLSIAARVAAREFAPSFVTPFRFISSHEQKTGAVLVVLSGITAGIAIGLLTFISLGIGSFVISLVTGILAAAAANLTVHTLLDWHYIKSSGLTEAIEKFGAATIDARGNVHTNIYILDKFPQNPQELDLKTTGMLVEGKQIWASTKYGALMLFAENESADIIAQTINGTVVEKAGKISGSRRAMDKLKTFFKKVNVDADIIGFEPGITIDHTSTGKKIAYNEMGTMIVTADLFPDIVENNRDVISVKLGELMTIRNAEKNALAETIYINLDGLTNITEFKKNLEVFNKVGNGQMIVDPAVFQGLTQGQIKGIAKFARKSGVQIYIDLRNSSGENIYKEMGFPGYVMNDEHNNLRMYDYYSPEGTAQKGVKAELISGYQNGEQLREKLKKSKETCKILNLSDLKNLLSGGERSILDRVALTELLKTTILSLYNTNTLSEQFVREVGYGWDRDKLPSLAERPADIDALAEAIKKEDNKTVESLIGLESVGLYLEKIRREAGDESKKEALRKAFLTSIAEKVLAKTKLDEISGIKGKESLKAGLADQRLEIMLGQKLLQQKMLATEGSGLSIAPESFVAEHEVSAETFYFELYKKVQALSVSTNPKDINALIELIAQLGEPKQILRGKKGEELFNAQAIEALLGAA
ncbi:MAG: AAA family ATPase [Elusimicrobia bacterium]|nr:AAA family ATPase [Elusimicrobiota bacterium]